jgi:glycerate kinase
MKIVLAPDSFKESLSAREVSAAMAKGVRAVRPDAVIDEVPLADGGEGTVEALIAATNGELKQSTVLGPCGDPIEAQWGLSGASRKTTAVIEMAAASGLALVPADQRNPMLTTTYGTGQLINAAIEAGAAHIIMGIGGSATNDGGVGAAQAVGVRFYEKHDRLLEQYLAGGDLHKITRIDTEQRRERIRDVRIRVACDVNNPLCGPRGAAATYARQKGATPQQVKTLDNNLTHLAALIKRDLDIEVSQVPGAGAAGGLGAGLLAFFGATLESGVRLMLDELRFAERIADADLVITGEGKIDNQSMMGKVIAGVGRACCQARIPVIALTGTIGEGAEQTREVLDGYYAINPPNQTQETAFARTAEAIEETLISLLPDLPSLKNKR